MKIHILFPIIYAICTSLMAYGEWIPYFDYDDERKNHVCYTYDPDTYSWELGYGEAIASNLTLPKNHTSIYIKDYLGDQYEKYLVVEIADRMCYGASTLHLSGDNYNLSIPQYIRKIGTEAFYGCSGFKGINFRNGGYYLKEIGAGAFMGCSGIENMNLNECDNLETIGNSAFKDCSNLKYAEIPANVKSIGASAFENCESLTRLSLKQKGNLKEIGGSAFANCSGFQANLNLPEGITTIGASAFYKTSFSGPLVLPSSLVEIGTLAFYYCINLQGSLVIPDKVTEIRDNTFAGCENISGNLIIGENVNYIGDDAFYNINKVRAVVVKSTTPPSGYRSPFSDYLYKNATLFVPEGTLSEYSTAKIWQNFVHIEELNYTPPTRIEATIGRTTLVSGQENTDNSIVITKGTKVPVQSAVTPYNPINNIVDWHSQDSLTCIVKDGYLEMTGDNSTLLTATTSNNLSVTFHIQEGTPISAIELPDTIVVELGKSKSIQYNVIPSGYHYGGYKWEVENPEVAEMNTRSSSITGKTLGCTSLSITAKDGWGATDTCLVKVIPPSVTAVTLNKNDVKYGVNEKHLPLQLAANVSPGNAVHDIIWTSSDDEIATVDTNGLVTFHGYGYVTIRAASAENEKIYDECKITLEYKTSVLLNGEDVYMRIYKDDKESKFTFQYEPSNLPITDVSFDSSDDNIFTVDLEGNATWIGEGSASVFCKYKLYDKIHQISKTVHCKPARFIASLSFKKPFIEVLDGENFIIDLTSLDIEPANALYNDIEWTVLDETILQKTTWSTQNAEFSAERIGETDIIAKAREGDAQAICHVTVLPIPVSSVSLSIEEWRMEAEEVTKIRAYCKPYNASIQSVSWSVRDTSIVDIIEVNSNELTIRAIDVGETFIEAKADVGSASATCHIVVIPTPLANIYLDTSFLEGSVGDEFQLDVSFYPQYATNKTIQWSSTAPDIVSVDNSGKVRLNMVGHGTIYAISTENPNIKASCGVTVKESTGIEDTTHEENPFVRIYSLDGILVYKGLYLNNDLKPGFYILSYKDKSIKLRMDSSAR